jgi:putative glycosyltransferase
MQLSVVTTLYRSAPYIREFHARVAAVVEQLGFGPWELVMVNDGSPDESLAVAAELAAADPRVVVVDLSRNFGHHKAMMTGLAHARGELVFLIDSDLEEEPEWLERFLHELTSRRVDVVYGVQEGRKGGLFERVSGPLYYAVYNWLSGARIPQNLVTTRLMTRRYVQALVSHQERELMIAGLWVITGFAQVPLVVNKLSLSPTTYTLGRKLTMLVDAITAFSNKPLIMIFYLGIAITAASLVAVAILLIRVVFFQALLPGWASLIVSVWLLGGITIFCLGVIGIYLSKIFMETKQRPYTIVREVIHHEAAVPLPVQE